MNKKTHCHCSGMCKRSCPCREEGELCTRKDCTCNHASCSNIFRADDERKFHCTCRGECLTEVLCTCIKAGMCCVDLCHCKNCSNSQKSGNEKTECSCSGRCIYKTCACRRAGNLCSVNCNCKLSSCCNRPIDEEKLQGLIKLKDVAKARMNKATNSLKFKFWFDEVKRLKKQIASLEDPHSHQKLSNIAAKMKADLTSSTDELDDETSRRQISEAVEHFASLGLEQVPYATAKYGDEFLIEDIIGLK